MSHSSVADRLSAEDAIFLYWESRKTPLHIGAVAVFDGPIPHDDFVRFVESKLPQIPRYLQRISVPPYHVGHPTWELDPDFDIRRHMRHVQLKRGTRAELQTVAGQVFSEVMERSKPLWDMTLIDGVKGGRTALILRVHHCLVDGVAGMGLINILLDRTPNLPSLPEESPLKTTPEREANSLAEALLNAYEDVTARIFSAQSAALDLAQTILGNHVNGALREWTRTAGELLAPIDRLPFNQPIHGPRNVAWTEFPLDEIAAIRRQCGGSTNDVALAVVADAVSRYAREHGQPVENRPLRIMAPVNLRRGTQHPGVGNQLSLLPVTVPLGCTDPAKLLNAVREKTNALKRAHVADLVHLGLKWWWTMPAPLLEPLISSTHSVSAGPPFHMICTNVPGPLIPLYLLGRRMLSCHPYVPLGADMGVCCALQTYDGNLHFTLVGDSLAAPDLNRMRDLLDEAFAALKTAAGVSVVRRKRAGARARRAGMKAESVNSLAATAPSVVADAPAVEPVVSPEPVHA